MRRKLIALVGKKQKGKDTFFRLLHAQSSRFKRFAFADGIKLDALMLPGVEEALEAHGKESLRKLYQEIGTVAKLGLGESYWIDALIEQINRDRQFLMIPVVTDCRFPFEATRLREEFDTTIIKLNRNTGLVDNHESETLVDDIVSDLEIDNNGSLEDLKKYAEAVAADYKI